VSDRLTFKLSDRYYGIDTSRVYGIIEVDEIYFLPGRRGFVKGVISLRGQLVTVLDSAVLSGGSFGGNETPGKIIVIQMARQFIGIDISSAEVFFVWDKKKGSHGDEKDNHESQGDRAPLTGPIADVPCEALFAIVEKILAPGRTKVLIADDMSFFRDAIRDALTSGGFEVVAEARNGQEAIEFAKELKPEIVILDIVMPVKNGLEAAGEISLLPHAPKIVICSSLDDDNIIKEAEEFGADAYITKPFTNAEALKTVLDIA